MNVLNNDRNNNGDPEKQKEMNDFFNKFDDEPEKVLVENKYDEKEIENKFDKITTRFDRSFKNSDRSIAEKQSDHINDEPDFNLGKLDESESDSDETEDSLPALNLEPDENDMRSSGNFSSSGVLLGSGDGVAALSDEREFVGRSARNRKKNAVSSESDEKSGLQKGIAWSMASVRGLMPERQTSGANSKEDNQDNTMAAKRSKKKKKYRLNFKKLIKSIILLGLALCMVAAIAVISIVLSAPTIDPDNIYASLPQHSIIYDRDGKELDSIYQAGQGQRTNITYSELPQHLVDAFVSIEDRTFWEHHGFNFVRIFGAIWESVSGGGRVSGTSTITQQLARNVFLEEEKTKYSLVRKIKEAYYAVELERKLDKKDILEAYLNTIYLGNQAYGVQAAAWNYFHKDVGELNLAESAVIAALAQLPNSFAPVKQINKEDADPETLNIITYYGEYAVYYNDSYRDRQRLILDAMVTQEKITQAERDEALNYDIFTALNPYQSNTEDISSYFVYYVRSQVISDLVAEGWTEEKATEMLNGNGLRIHTTLDLDMQQKTEAIFALNSNFPNPRRLNKDGNGNVRDKSNNILMYDMNTYFDAEGTFWLAPGEYEFSADGSLTLFDKQRLNFYRTETQGNVDVNVEFKTLYTNTSENGFLSIDGGVVAIKSEYKTKNDQGNLIINAQFFKDNPDFFVSDGNGNLGIPSNRYTLRQGAVQPQGAMVIMDHQTGEIRAMIGGRNLEGKMLFNRATGTRQPGSAIKPISVYAAALQSAVDGASSWTAASSIVDEQMYFNGSSWPKNWYSGYRGRMTLRQSIEQSVNTNAVKVFMDIGVDRAVDSLTKLGVTSIISEGNVNDLNAAALALGGMTRGISPLQMTAAYSAFPNGGVYTEPVCYTSVTNRSGDIILQKQPQTVQAMDPGVAWIMTDMLRTTVTSGIASSAGIGTQPVAGKTGTTTDNYDAWFVGFTPYYSAALWIGNDVNIELDSGSTAAARLWSKVMKEIHTGLPTGSFRSRPSNVVTASVDTVSGKLASEYSSMDPRGTVRTEYFVQGTQPTEVDDVHVAEYICIDSGLKATPWCTNAEHRVLVSTGDGSSASDYDVPHYYCYMHNLDTVQYPIPPDTQTDPNFVPDPDPDDSDGNGSNGSDGNGSEPGDSDNGDIPIVDSGGGESETSTIPDWLAPIN